MPKIHEVIDGTLDDAITLIKSLDGIDDFLGLTDDSDDTDKDDSDDSDESD